MSERDLLRHLVRPAAEEVPAGPGAAGAAAGTGTRSVGTGAGEHPAWSLLRACRSFLVADRPVQDAPPVVPGDGEPTAAAEGCRRPASDDVPSGDRPAASHVAGAGATATHLADAEATATHLADAGATVAHVAVAGAAAGTVAVPVALELLRGCRAPCAVVCDWGGTSPAGATATRGARRTAERLSSRGHAATAVGRLVRVALPHEDRDAATDARRVLAAAGASPVVLALAAPRGPDLDALLAAVDRVLVVVPADAPDGLAELALAGVARRATARVTAGEPSAIDRALARSGRARRSVARRAHAALTGPPEMGGGG